MSKTTIPRSLRRKVEDQPRHRCGYCLRDEEIVGPILVIDHIIPEAAGGKTEEENLWPACAWCNAHKGDRTRARDPQTGRMVPLFNPRRQKWSRHFKWSEDGTEIIGLTACGRATEQALCMNNPKIMAARRRWVEAGWWPPQD